MSLFNRQRRAWRALPKSQRLKPVNWFRISTHTGMDFRFAGFVKEIVSDGPDTIDETAGIEWKNPVEISGFWGEPEPAFSFTADYAGGRVPRRTKRAIQKWRDHEDVGPRERERLHSVRMVATSMQ